MKTWKLNLFVKVIDKCILNTVTYTYLNFIMH